MPGLTPMRLEEDHISIAKPPLASSLVYASVDWLLTNLISQPATRSARRTWWERNAGDWWGRVITSGHESAPACNRIEKDRQMRQAFLNGRSFNLNVDLVAEWRSTLLKVESSARI